MTNEELIEQIHKGVNPSENMEKLYEQNKGMICKTARKYAALIDIEDLMQEAYFGLHEAVKHYENDSEVKFITYATFWIKQSMQRYVENNASTIRISVHTQQLYNKFSKVVNSFIEKHNRKPTDREASRLLDTSVKRVQYIKKALYEVANMDSLEQSIGGENDDICLSDFVIGSNGIENDIVDRIIDSDKKTSLWDIVEDNTTDKENLVIVYRYKGKKTREDIGNEIGVSGERVRQIEVAALRKLRSPRIKRMLAERYEIVIQGAYRGSIGNFNSTWTSATERAALKIYNLRR